MKEEHHEIRVYLDQFPIDVRKKLRLIRSLILEICPEAQESISYGIPAYKLNNKPLIYFAGFKKHIGLYATPSGHQAFRTELSGYKQGKGSVQFPLNQEIPFELIGKIVQFNKQSILD